MADPRGPATLQFGFIFRCLIFLRLEDNLGGFVAYADDISLAIARKSGNLPVLVRRQGQRIGVAFAVLVVTVVRSFILRVTLIKSSESAGSSELRFGSNPINFYCCPLK